jgi:hypothetical protein
MANEPIRHTKSGEPAKYGGVPPSAPVVRGPIMSGNQPAPDQGTVPPPAPPVRPAPPPPKQG